MGFSQRMNEHRSGSRNARYDLIITGVAADPPGNSHLQFGFLVSLATVPSAFGPTPIRLWVFVFSGLVVAALALATAGLKSARATHLNPAEQLRFE